MSEGKLELPELLDAQTLAYIMSVYHPTFVAWTDLTSEIVPEKIPLEVLLAFNGVGRALVEFGKTIVPSARALGYEGPDIVVPG